MNTAVIDPPVDADDLTPAAPCNEFFPHEPQSLADAGLTLPIVESLVLKFLLNNGATSGRQIAAQVRLPFGWLREILSHLKTQLLVGYRESAPMSDYLYELSDGGVEKARKYEQRSTYFGSAPVALPDYVRSVAAQSIRRQRPRIDNVREALDDLIVSDLVLSQIGQAVHDGHGLFLYGSPGNGKTCIAERIARCVSPHVWIPRTICVTGEIIRLFDPNNHVEAPPEDETNLLASSKFDRRWVRIRRPTVVAGGELTMRQLDFSTTRGTGIVEAPLQLKSNCGVLVIDDFGRQSIATDALLNRWIVPLEKAYDYLTLPSGRQLRVPFDQLLVFATNLEPSHLVDEAFLRRIPHKVQVADPTEQQFRGLFARLARNLRIACPQKSIEYLIQKHYKAADRSFRFCHARDLLRQVKNFCEFHELPSEATPQNLDLAVINYFGGL